MDAQTARDAGGPETEIARRLHGLTVRRMGLALGLWGEAGVGKTYTVERWLRALPARSLSLPAAAPLADWAQKLPRPVNMPIWVLKVLENLQGGKAVQATSLSDALGAVLAGLAPFVLHLEDLHEADPERADLVEQLASLVRRSRGVGLIVTSRQPLPPSVDGHRQEPLTPGAAANLLQAEAGATLPAAAITWIYGRAAGNPLFTLEYFRLLARQGQLWNDAQRWHWRPPQAESMPVTVEALIERTLQGVCGPGALGDLLGARALLPRAEEPLWTATAGLGLDTARAAQAELERRGLWVRGDFAHPLYREVSLHALGVERCRLLAQRALENLLDDPTTAASLIGPAQLARAQAVVLLERAAAWPGTDPLQSARYLARAAEVASGASQGQLAIRAARALELVDEAAALRLAQLAASVLPDDPEALLLLASRHAVAGHAAELEAVLARIPDRGRQQSWVSRIIALRFQQGNHREVVALWQDHPDLQDCPGPETAYHVGFSSLFALPGPASQTLAERLATTALQDSDLSPILRSRLLTVCGLVQMYRETPESLEAAESDMNASVLYARQHGQSAWLASALHNRSILLERLGRYPDMLQDVEEALRRYGEAGLSRYFASTQAKLGRQLYHQGSYAQAEEALLESRALLMRGDASSFLVTCEAHLSLVYVAWAPPHAAALALKHAREALRLAREVGQLGKVGLALCCLSRAESRFGQPQEGLRLAEEVAQLVGTEGVGAEPDHEMKLALGFALSALERSEQALGVFRAAEQVARKAGMTREAELAGLEADHLTRNEESAERRRHWFETQGLLHGALVAQRYFPATPGGTVSSGQTATLTQLDVLGPMRIGPVGHQLPVRGRKRRALLAILLEAALRGRPEVARLDLLDVMYPGVDELQAGPALKELVHLTRAALGPGVIQTTTDGYALGTLASDAARFLEGGDTALWRGLYLQDTPLAQRNEGIQDALHQALLTRSEALLKHDPQEAARTARLLLEAEPYAPELLVLALNALRACGNHRSLQRVYQEARLRMADVGEKLPEHWGDFLAARIS